MLYRWSFCKGATPTLLEGGGHECRWNAWPRSREGDWEALKEVLSTRNLVPHYYEDGVEIEKVHDAKNCLPSISGAVYPPREKRGKEFLQSVNLLVLDVDNKGEPETHLTREKAIELFQASPCKVFMYATYSDTETRNKMRMVLPLAAPVRPDLWAEYLEWAIAHLGLGQYRDALDLGCMRKPSQVYFLKGKWEGEAFATAKDGDDLPVPEDSILETLAVPDLPGKPGVRQVRAGEMVFIKSCNVDLTSLDLCAVLRHKGIKVGLEQDLYEKGVKVGNKTRCHCPWAHEHTGGRDDDSAYIIEVDGKWSIFRCSHSNHLDLGLFDVLDWAGPSVVCLYADPYVRLTSNFKHPSNNGSISFTGAL